MQSQKFNLSIIIMKISTLILLFIVLVNVIAKVQIKDGQVYINVQTPSQQENKMKVNINAMSKTQIQLTQSSKIKLQAKITFSEINFKPQFFSFRLKHQTYDNLTQPILVSYDDAQQSFTALIDLGDSKHIKPFSGKYMLEIIISDEKLTKNIKNNIAKCSISFRNSLTQIPHSQLLYKVGKLIESNPPPQRIDPPQTFTLYVVGIIIAFFGLYIYGLNYLQVNFKLFPTSSSGMIWNFLLVVMIIANFGILFNFWRCWTFLETIKYMFIVLPPTIIIANYALIHIKKQ